MSLNNLPGNTNRGHKIDCPWCSSRIELSEFEHSFRRPDKVRAMVRCKSCLMNNTIHKNRIGYYSLYKSDYARYMRNVANKTNRITPKFK